MTVNEAMDMMKQQQRGYVVGGNKALDAKLSAVGEDSGRTGAFHHSTPSHVGTAFIPAVMQRTRQTELRMGR